MFYEISFLVIRRAAKSTDVDVKSNQLFNTFLINFSSTGYSQLFTRTSLLAPTVVWVWAFCSSKYMSKVLQLLFFFSCSALLLAVQLDLHHQGVGHLLDLWVLYLVGGLSQRLKHGKSSGHNHLSDGGGCLLGFSCGTWRPNLLPDALFSLKCLG